MPKLILVTFLAAILTIIAIETVFERQYKGTKDWLREIVINDNSDAPTFDNIGDCTLDSVEVVPTKSTAIIGHAYGDPIAPGDFVSPQVQSFIRKNYAYLDNVLFTGDVIADPSTAKWKQLIEFSQEIGVKFHIAPGNHDVGIGDNSRRDIWNETPFQLPDDDLKIVQAAGFSFAFEDSISTGWQIDPNVIEKLSKIELDGPLVVLRHNVAIQEMEIIANSNAGRRGPLPTLENLSRLLPSGTVVISGDAGAFETKPRFACAQKNNVTFIANGVGGINGDLVLIASEGKLFIHSLDQFLDSPSAMEE